MKRISEDRQDAAVHRLEEEQEHKEQARQRKEEQEEARQQKEEVCQRVEEVRQQKEEQEGKQAPKARGKYKTFDEQMEDLKRYKETHGRANVSIPEDKSLAKFCTQARHRRKNPGKSKRKQLTNEEISAFDALGFDWTSQEYMSRVV